MRIRLIPEAEADVAEGYGWYREPSAGLGARFRDALHETLEGVAHRPQAFPVVHGDLRRALLKRFPYMILFLHARDEIVVFACFHVARDARAWARRAQSHHGSAEGRSEEE